MAVKLLDPTRLDKGRVLTLAALIEGKGCPIYDRKGAPLGFNMATWESAGNGGMVTDVLHRKCNTVACIGGTADILFGNRNHGLFSTERASEALGLDEDAGEALFYPSAKGGWNHGNDDNSWRKITPAKAARVLRHLVKTGEVDWSIR